MLILDIKYKNEPNEKGNKQPTLNEQEGNTRYSFHFFNYIKYIKMSLVIFERTPVEITSIALVF